MRCGASGSDEQHRAECDVLRTARDELDDVLCGRDSAHADDRKPRRCVACVHGCERDRLERRTGETAGAAREHRLQRARIEREPAQRVDEREAVGAGRCDRARDLARRRDARRRASRRAEAASRRGRRRRSRPRNRLLRRRSGRRGSARSPRRRGGERTSRRSPQRRSRRPRSRAAAASSRSRGRRLGEEALASGIGEADRVQHPVRGLGDAWRRVPLARQRRDRLRHEAVELTRDVGRDERVEAAGSVKQQRGPVLRRTGASARRRSRRRSRSSRRSRTPSALPRRAARPDTARRPR